MGWNEWRTLPLFKAVSIFLLYFVIAKRKSVSLSPPTPHPPGFPVSHPRWCLIPSSKLRGCAVINDYKVFRTDDYQSAPDAPAFPLHNFRDFDVLTGSCFPSYCTQLLPSSTLYSLRGVKKQEFREPQ